MNEVETHPPPSEEIVEDDEDSLAIGAGFDFTDPNSPLAPFYLRASQVLAVALLVFVFILLNYLPLWHTDIWGHLKFGEATVTSGRLPDGDPFCPFADRAPTALHYCWLAQCTLYLLYRGGELLAGGDGLRGMAGGVDMLRLAHAVSVLLRCVVLLAALRRVTGSRKLALLGLTVTLALSFGHIGVARPQVVGELLFACVLLTLSQPLLSRRALVMLPLMFIVWANWHSSFAAGLLLLGLWATGRALEVVLTTRGARVHAALADSQMRRLTLALILCAVVSLLNPEGFGVYRNLLAMSNHPNVLAMDEWQPLALSLAPGAHWIYLLAAGLVILTPLVCGQRYAGGAVLVALVFGLQPLWHQRMTLWWVMLAPWLALPLWSNCRRAWAARLRFASVPSFRKTLLAAMFVLVALAWSIPTQWLLAGRPVALERSLSQATPWQLAQQLRRPEAKDAEWLPVLSKWLRERNPGGHLAGPIFASETLGDHLMWALGDNPPVFVYSHVHLFSAQHWERCGEVLFGGPNWRSVLDSAHINLVVVEAETHPRLRALLRTDPAWAVLLDETGSAQKRNIRTRLLVAVRK